MAWYYWLIIIVVVIVMISNSLNKKKKERLMKKYNDESLVEKIMNGEYWEGQTKEQLEDSLGKPEEKNEQVLKTKINETYKYQKEGDTNRFKLKIYLENAIVVGWDKK